METEKRLELTHQSLISRNKKLTQILDNKTVFEEKIDSLQTTLEAALPLKNETETRSVLEGNDISVCVRVRPILEYEERANYFR